MPPRKRLTNEENFRGDLLEEEEKATTNEALEEAAQRLKEEDLTPSHYSVHSTGKVTKMAGGMIDPSEWNLGDIPEPEVLSDGDEIKVSIIGVTDAETKAGSIPYWRITLEVPDKPLVKDFSFNLYKPHDSQSAKESYNAKYRIQQFMKAFNLDMSRPFDPESDWIGEQAWCIVSMREDKEYGKQNQIRKWILPK